MTFPDIQGRCPACNGSTLFLADGGYITCSWIECPTPDAASQIISEVADARQHGAYTFCDQLVGHVSMREFAKKITEKVTAVAHREEAVKYANEQKQRADQAEELLRIAHEASNKSEVERARAAAALYEVLAAFRHVIDDATRTTVGYVSARVRPADYDRWRAVLNPPKDQP